MQRVRLESLLERLLAEVRNDGQVAAFDVDGALCELIHAYGSLMSARRGWAGDLRGWDSLELSMMDFLERVLWVGCAWVVGMPRFERKGK